MCLHVSLCVHLCMHREGTEVYMRMYVYLACAQTDTLANGTKIKSYPDGSVVQYNTGEAMRVVVGFGLEG